MEAKTRVKENKLNKFFDGLKTFFESLVESGETSDTRVESSVREIEAQEGNKKYIDELAEQTGTAHISLDDADKGFVPHAKVSEQTAMKKASEKSRTRKELKNQEKIRE